jgi:hypothetical protein
LKMFMMSYSLLIFVLISPSFLPFIRVSVAYYKEMAGFVWMSSFRKPAAKY